MKRSNFIKLIQDVGASHEKMLELYAVQAARYPNNKDYRKDAELYALKDEIARQTADKIISLVHQYLPGNWDKPKAWEYEKEEVVSTDLDSKTKK